MLTGAAYRIGNASNDLMAAEGGNDTLFGGQGNDTVSGGDGNDLVLGNKGNDHVFGNAGDDTLFGGTGNDTLFGGTGDDFLVTDDGFDYIVIEANGGHDIVADFEAGVDRLILADGFTTANVTVETSSEGDALLRLSADHTVRLVGVPPSDVNDGFFI